LSKRLIGRLARRAALESYGVARVSGPRWYDRLLGVLGFTTPGVDVRVDGGVGIELHVGLAHGVPAQAVVANVAERVRYVIQRELGQDVASLTVFVNGRQHRVDAAGGPG
jgi:uncharacterized alkaline shock family protein YloU